jgi:4a-hydroxytetrahydrobiopterin dehydratase
MERSSEKLTPDQVLAAGLDDWRKLAQALHARFRTGSFTAGLELVTAITEAAERANHHPDVTLTYPVVDIRLMSHDVGAVTQRDVDLAREISAVARARGVAAEPAAPTVLELALDTADTSRVAPFWAAVLTGDAGNVDGDDVVDKTGQVPLLWFQATDEHDQPRQRFHLDVWVPHDQAEARIEAALAAGGTLGDDAEKPSFVVLADADGNKACICTMLDRA